LRLVISSFDLSGKGSAPAPCQETFAKVSWNFKNFQKRDKCSQFTHLKKAIWIFLPIFFRKFLRGLGNFFQKVPQTRLPASQINCNLNYNIFLTKIKIL